LRKTPTRRRAENNDAQAPHVRRAARLKREGEAALEFGRQIAVDLEPDADLNENRSGPGHFTPSIAQPGRSLGSQAAARKGAHYFLCPQPEEPAAQTSLRTPRKLDCALPASRRRGWGPRPASCFETHPCKSTDLQGCSSA
jgi:hypothetical protein